MILTGTQHEAEMVLHHRDHRPGVMAANGEGDPADFVASQRPIDGC